MACEDTDENSRWTVRTPERLDRDRVNSKLVPFELEPLSFGSIKPRGWMRDQLQVMADGLPGHLHEFYRLVAKGRATWLGGDDEYSQLNEAWPYWYNGVIALAYGADNARLKNVLTDMTEYVLEHQISDGWFGPETDVRRRNFWGRYPFLLGVMQLIEVCSGSDQDQAERLLNAVHHFIVLTHGMLANDSQGYVWHGGDDFDQQWGRARAADMLIFLQWLYEKHPRQNSQKIHECMVWFYNGSYDWTYWFRPDIFYKGDFDQLVPDIRWTIFPYIHGVNAGQGLKYGAVMRRLTHLHSYVDSTKQGVEMSMRYHGSSSGAILGDEGLSGVSPIRGTELCSVVETLYSLTYNYQALGDKDYADRAELAAYNALPVMHTPDWWAHQYIAQANQPISQRIDNPPFWNVGPLGTTFGVEPNYPCCAVNHPQGFPKFLSTAFTKVSKNGIAHSQLMPAEAVVGLSSSSSTTTPEGLQKDESVHIVCDTSYPFENVLRYAIATETLFEFSFRVPSWASSYLVSVNDVATEVTKYDKHTGLATMKIEKGRTRVSVALVTAPRVENRGDDTVAIHYGALLFALPVQADYTSRASTDIPNAPEQAREYTIRPRKDAVWNVAIDPATVQVKTFASFPPSHLSSSIAMTATTSDLPTPIWTIDAAPIRLTAQARRVRNWTLTSSKGGYCGAIPSPDKRKFVGAPFEVELQPYGALKVHIAEFPVFNAENVIDVDNDDGSNDTTEEEGENDQEEDDGEEGESGSEQEQDPSSPSHRNSSDSRKSWEIIDVLRST